MVPLSRTGTSLSPNPRTVSKTQHIFSQSQQSLTCQIHLGLLHEPYALAPYGHLASYNCLVSCFTTVPLDITPNPLPVPRRSKHVRIVV
ncbi:hypothetical protein JAAARDRAFT_543256 [Jaapia argillacea MUCL 33604]|uniref:Uncharacterized protein n=1 Tax=Jaapia argillacea MUCL 33604 TaxID=933084 RepID=A0A067PKK0_9AGAM|nr:hypothetical protein JAAARDRAFT_543256 [Jaapia argillacea MUCL 33604]